MSSERQPAVSLVGVDLRGREAGQDPFFEERAEIDADSCPARKAVPGVGLAVAGLGRAPIPDGLHVFPRQRS
jgi:hypothetical protein